MRKCAAKCKVYVVEPHLFCSEHWKKLPVEIQTAIADAWAEREQDKTILVRAVTQAQGLLARSS